MFKILNSSTKTYFIIEKINSFTNYLCVLILILGLAFSLLWSPVDYIQGHSVRIMYVHVPSAWISLACFGVMGFFSILSFIFKTKTFGLISKSLAPLGLMFCLIAIVTGSLWGQPTWGTWWVWDARLTSMIILGVFYFIYIMSWKLISNKKLANNFSSIIAILGLINLPIIKFSVDWWATLHQTSSINILSSNTMHYTMLIPLLIMFLGLSLYSLAIFFMKYKIEIIKLKNERLDKI